MPPIMGAGAFIMASYTQVPYLQIVAVSVLPAILYFLSVGFWVRIEAKLLAMDPVAFATLGEAIAEQQPLLDRLGEIACPTSIIVGAQDSPFVPAADELESGIEGARRTTIADAAHSPQLENQAAWLDTVREHLAWARGD